MLFNDFLSQFIKKFIDNFFRFFYENFELFDRVSEPILLNLFCFFIFSKLVSRNMMSLIDALNDPNHVFFSRIQTKILKLLLDFFFEIRDFISNFVSDFRDFLNVVFVEESLIEIFMQMIDSYEALAF